MSELQKKELRAQAQWRTIKPWGDKSGQRGTQGTHKDQKQTQECKTCTMTTDEGKKTLLNTPDIMGKSNTGVHRKRV